MSLLLITSSLLSSILWLSLFRYPLELRRRFRKWCWTLEANSLGFSAIRKLPRDPLRRRRLIPLSPPLSLSSRVLIPFANPEFPILPSPLLATRIVSATIPTSTPTAPTPRATSSGKSSPFLVRSARRR